MDPILEECMYCTKKDAAELLKDHELWCQTKTEHNH